VKCASQRGIGSNFDTTEATLDPTKPELRILNINLIAVLYTTKIAMNYFRLQPEDPARDRCFIFKGSIAGLLDQPGSWQYSTSKFGLRGLMRSMRHTTWQSGIRVNYVGPCEFTTSVREYADALQSTQKQTS